VSIDNGTIARNLLRWADEVEFGEWEHSVCFIDGKKGACLKGIILRMEGYDEASYAECFTRAGYPVVEEHFDHVTAPYGVKYTSTYTSREATEVEHEIVAEYARLGGSLPEDAHGYELFVWDEPTLDTLNDYWNAESEWPRVAQAMRNVARKMQEQEAGAPIVVAEAELVEVGA
jgi:hypothetical protein